MNITIDLQGLSGLAESINNLADALRAGAKADEVIKTASRKAKKTEQTTPAPEPSTAPAEPSTAPAEPAAVSASPSEPAPDLPKQAKEALLKVVRANGHPAGAAVLQQFGASKLSDLKPDDFEAFIEAASKVIP